ncbi:hypothetical protein AtNW77_Chr1g0068631 [Arabidopsis thaliana]|uniref:Uncharacterized protein n=2 Tax=Arabidopsis thaliana TaxID=3702 RepID=A0A654EXP0_ARATH|nr:uncharacterized protein AT1G67855 [Arabidopsis thaliana]AEE34708.1 hypothetical protein AT1G67855 [Arabidopsis thaliana]CAA0322459.1 unnamed protein product [Arabidopsis thaliana]VYS50331.1 unnamed protein product [Arabidopsis thaliana]|eukprot:NP_176952.2 hypothetical protein AT1G67855 [Arabidopsis thaliana]
MLTTDLTMFFTRDTETTVFITSIGITPSDAVGSKRVVSRVRY